MHPRRPAYVPALRASRLNVDVLVVYDINTESRVGRRRLGRVAAICERYGNRVQKSVFECRITSTAVQRLVNELTSEIDKDADSILIYRFPGNLAEARAAFGLSGSRDLGDFWIV